ncbi:MAG: mechanosensitive ion channel family protein [Candidatus Margulisbacteria bacterium]|nr:mechanosensitive ion channel family protein [Candidatus Margulisiibacteriota bacterium]
MTKTILNLFYILEVRYGVSEAVVTSVAGILLLFVTWLSYRVFKYLFLGMVEGLIKRSHSHWDDVFLAHKVLSPIPAFLPIILLYTTSGIVLEDHTSLYKTIQKLLLAMVVIVGLRIASRFVDAMMTLAKEVPVLRHKPLTSYAQVFKIVLYVVSVVLVLSTLLGKSPWLLLSGLGAVAAVLLVVFKDAILGFSASLQLSANDMVRPGDWIEMQKYGADGDVLDVSLTTVKVQNFDKTITTIPNYALISDSFKNWRGMLESGGRRIRRSLMIDTSSIQFCTPEMLDSFSHINLLKDYLAKKRAVLDQENQNQTNLSVSVNGRRLTNIGTFRAYVKAYLWQHPKIRRDMMFVIRQLPPSAQGLPLEVCVFSTEQDLVPFEEVQADIFDHLLAAIPEFNLRVFQEPTGADFGRLV